MPSSVLSSSPPLKHLIKYSESLGLGHIAPSLSTRQTASWEGSLRGTKGEDTESRFSFKIQSGEMMRLMMKTVIVL